MKQMTLDQHVAQWWDTICEIKKLGTKITELRQQQAELEADQALVEERINQAAGGCESMVFAVESDTYVVLAWQEYTEDFVIELLEKIR